MVQERFAKNRKAPARYKAEEAYLLTTKLHCGRYGAYMVGESGVSATGKIYRHYKCANNKNRKGCKKKAVPKAWIEELALETIKDMLFEDNFVEYVSDLVTEVQNRENTAMPLFKKQIAEAERNINNMLNAIQQGVVTSSTKKRLEELEETKGNLEASILQEEIENPQISREEVKFYIDKYRKMDLIKGTHRQQLVDGFVNAIFVYDDKLVLTFNYKDGTKEISLEEISSSDMGSQPAASHILKGSAFGEGIDWTRRNSCSVLATLVKRCLPSCALIFNWLQSVTV